MPNPLKECLLLCIELWSTKGPAQHHPAPLARALCSSLRDHLEKALTDFNVASGSLLDLRNYSFTFLVGFLIFLAASKDNHWETALLAEFRNDSKDVLGDIGCIRHQVLL